jgi:hypothetical protein
MPHLRTIASVLVACNACLVMAQDQPNFSGVWQLNNDKSTFDGKPPARMRMQIDHQGTNLVMTSRIVGTPPQQDQQTYRYAIGGNESRNEMHGAPMKSRVRWDSGILAIDSVTVLMKKELHLDGRYALSEDRNVLTLRERRQYGDEAERQVVYVFERQPASSWEPDVAPKPAEEVYKNIKVLKGLPAPRLQAVMMGFTKSLGVQCGHCHVQTQGQFEWEKDDLPAKEMARTMLKMARNINQENFGGNAPVSCWTCHRGQTKPQSSPPE